MKIEVIKIEYIKIEFIKIEVIKLMWINKPGTGIISLGTKTYLLASNWDVFTTYPGWVGV